MTAILHAAKSDGVNLALTMSGTIKANGHRDAVARWLPQLRERKTEIIDALTVGADTTAATFDQEWFEERAAIYEFEAGFSRQEAERRAYPEVMNHG